MLLVSLRSAVYHSCVTDLGVQFEGMDSWLAIMFAVKLCICFGRMLQYNCPRRRSPTYHPSSPHMRPAPSPASPWEHRHLPFDMSSWPYSTPNIFQLTLPLVQDRIRLRGLGHTSWCWQGRHGMDDRCQGAGIRRLQPSWCHEVSSANLPLPAPVTALSFLEGVLPASGLCRSKGSTCRSSIARYPIRWLGRWLEQPLEPPRGGGHCKQL
jgi:hypothetical protein